MSKNLHTIEEQLEKAGQGVFLSDIEKAQVRGRLINAMDTPSPFMSRLIHIRTIRFGVVPLVIIFLVFGGITTASADALPGDPLYLLKTIVYEPVIGLTLREEERVTYQKELAEKRLAELVELSAAGDVSDVIQDTVFEKFDTHLKSAEEQARDLSVEEVFAVQSEIESELRAHERVFAELDETGIREEIQARVTSVVKARAESEIALAFADTDLEEVVEVKKEEASSAITLAEEEVIAGGDDRIALQTQVQVSLAKQALEEADMDVEAGAFTEAVVQYERAKRFAKEAELVMTLTSTFAVVPEEIDQEQVALLEEKTKAPIFEATSLAVSESLEVDDLSVVEEPQNVYEYFQGSLLARMNGQITPEMYLALFIGFEPSDFNGVIANGGIYEVVDEEVLFIPTIDTEDGVSPEILEYEGHIRLLINVATRMGIELSSNESVDLIISNLTQSTILLPEVSEEELELVPVEEVIEEIDLEDLEVTEEL